MCKRRNVTWLMTFLVALMSTGCWDAKDISEILPVAAIAVDLGEDGQIHSSFAVPLTKPMISAAGSKGEPNGGANSVIDGYGNTFEDCIVDASRKSSKRLFFPHSMALVFGSDFASKVGIGHVLNYTQRATNFRENQLVIVSDGQAKDLLSSETSQEYLNAQYVQQLQRTDALTKKSVESEVLNELICPSHAAPVLWLSKQANHVEMSGMGLIQGDKLIKLVDQRHAVGITWMIGPTREENITLDLKDNKQATVHVIYAKPTFEFHEGKVPAFEVSVHGYGNITRMPRGIKPDQKSIDALQQASNSMVVSNIQLGLRVLQKAGADAVGIGTTISRENHTSWIKMERGWQDEFKTFPVTVHADIKLIRHGVTKGNPLDYYSPADS